jgi:NADH-quinone oxidoreductase subunit C
MTPTDIANRLSTQFGDAILASLPEDKHPRVEINSENWRKVAEFIFGDPDLKLNFLACITSVDYVADNQLALVYDLRSHQHGHWFAIKVLIDRENPTIPTVMDMWPAADWHEREAYDMMGIVFEGHTDLRRILLPEDWVGYPLRKDYVFPREYHGIPGTYELDWQQKPDYPV